MVTFQRILQKSKLLDFLDFVAVRITYIRDGAPFLMDVQVIVRNDQGSITIG